MGDLECPPWLTLPILQPSVRRASAWLDQPSSARRSQTRRAATLELHSHHHHYYHYPRCCVLFKYCIPLYLTCGSEQKSVGWDQFDHHTSIHKWSHVQPHPKSPICGRERPRGYILLCRWIFQSIWHGDPNRSCYLYVSPVDVPTHLSKTYCFHPDGTLSFATIALALRVPRMSDPKKQQLAVFIWGGVMFGMYSFLLSVFRIKNGGYPFHLPPF